MLFANWKSKYVCVCLNMMTDNCWNTSASSTTLFSITVKDQHSNHGRSSLYLTCSFLQWRPIMAVRSYVKSRFKKKKSKLVENKCLSYLEACSGMLTQRWHRCVEASRASSSLCTSQWCSLNRWADSCRGWWPHRTGQSMSVIKHTKTDKHGELIWNSNSMKQRQATAEHRNHYIFKKM